MNNNTFLKYITDQRQLGCIDTQSINWGLVFDLYALPQFAGLLHYICEDSAISNLPIDLYWVVKSDHQKRGMEYERILQQMKYVRMIELTRNPVYGDAIIETRIVLRIVNEMRGFFQPPLIRGDYLWEMIYEKIRLLFYPEKPSRLASYFLFSSSEDYSKYLKLSHVQPGRKAGVSVIETRKQHIADMVLFTEVPNEATFSQAAGFAHRYWSGKTSPDPIMEVIFQGKCEVRIQSN